MTTTHTPDERFAAALDKALASYVGLGRDLPETARAEVIAMWEAKVRECEQQSEFAQRLLDDIATLRARAEAAERARDAWREFAQHQEVCAECAVSVRQCADGTELKDRAALETGA